MRASIHKPTVASLPHLECCPVEGCATTFVASRRMCSSHWHLVSADTKSMLRSYDQLILSAKSDEVRAHLQEQRNIYWRKALLQAGGCARG